MANLETAGAAALDKLKELLPEFENAEKAFDKAEQDMQKAQADLERDWKEVETAATAFMATFVTAFALLTDALRDAMDPKLR